MTPNFRRLILGFSILMAAIGSANDKSDVGPNGFAQSAADNLRSFASSELAFIHAGFLKDSFNKDDLASWLTYPSDEIVVMSLKGDQIRQAFELSVSLYPEMNKSFLQISGAEATFKKSGPVNGRVTTITVGGSPLEPQREYSVAMPSILARGAVGYFRIWGKAKPVREFPNKTMEDVLRGKKAIDESPRWIAVN